MSARGESGGDDLRLWKGDDHRRRTGDGELEVENET